MRPKAGTLLTATPRHTTQVNCVVLLTFQLEVMVKLCAQGMAPWRYFIGPEAYWNAFDLAIVTLSLPFLETTLYASGDGAGGGSGSKVKILRLLRLARFARLVNKVPKLRVIVQGLVG